MRSWLINSFLILTLVCGTAALVNRNEPPSPTEEFKAHLLGSWELKSENRGFYLERVPMLTEDQAGFWFLPNGKLIRRSRDSSSPHEGGMVMSKHKYKLDSPTGFFYNSDLKTHPNCYEQVYLRQLGPNKIEVEFSKYPCSEFRTID